MKRLIRNLSIKNQLLLVILPVVLLFVGSSSFINYNKLHQQLLINENSKIEALKHSSVHFKENYDLNVFLNHKHLESRFEELFPKLINYNIDYSTVNLDSLSQLLDLDTALEELLIINSGGEIINTSYIHNRNKETNQKLKEPTLKQIFKQKSALYLFENDMQNKLSHSNQAYLALNDNFILNIQIKSDSLKHLKNELEENLFALSNTYENVLAIDVLSKNKNLQTKNFKSNVLDSIQKELYENKKINHDTTIVIKNDTNSIYVNYIYIDVNNTGGVKDYLLQIISDDRLEIKLFKKEAKWFFVKLIVLTIIIILFLLAIAKMITKPITLLSSEIDTMTKEEELSEININSNTETKSLSDKFNVLTNLINNFQYSLEQKINERTKDLNQKNIVLEKLLKEREALIKEIHHRVKNSLQIVSSLLSLQAKMVDDEKAKAAFLESINRIQAIGLLHEKLYKNADHINVYAQSYLTELVKIYKKTLNSNIKINLSVDDVIFDSSQAISIGLIINEFISNSLKHAFNESESGTIDIILEKTDNEVILMLKNDGKPLPKDFNPGLTDDSLGMTIIEAFTEKLDGTYEFYNIENGVELKVIFPLNKNINKS